jgi:hypothetical protein
MSELSPSAPGKAGPPKQPVSPVRNIIGLVVLVAVIVIGYLEYSAKAAYNAAVTKLNKRLEDEEHGLPTESDTAKLIAKQPDDAGTDVQEAGMNFTKKTYTWKALFIPYTLAAYYTKAAKGSEPALHHIEAGEKFQPLPPAPAAPSTSEAPPPEALKKRAAAESRGMRKGQAEGKGKAPADEKQAPEPEEKAKAPADEKAKAPADEKTKAAADQKAPEPEQKSKAATDEKTKTE